MPQRTLSNPLVHWARMLVLLALSTASVAGPSAAELRIGLAELPSTLDPHADGRSVNRTVLAHLYETLVQHDDKYHLRGALAVRWEAVEPTRWVFTLRPGARFADGQPVTADDVLFSFERAADGQARPNGPWRSLTDMRFVARDARTFEIITREPDPSVPRAVTNVYIASKATGLAIGSGRYRPGEQGGEPGFVLQRNELHWGLKPQWVTVRLRVIPSATERVAALLRGEVDIIERVPSRDLAYLGRDQRFQVVQRVSDRLIYLQLDQGREGSYYLRSKSDDGIDNPLLSQSVRLALSLSIDRQALADNVLKGTGVPAGQLVPNPFFGHHLNLPAPTQDLKRARELLGSAGHANGFKVVIHYPESHYRFGGQVIARVIDDWAKVGLQAEARAVPDEAYFTRATRGAQGGKPEFSIALFGWRSTDGEPMSALEAILQSHDRNRGQGLANRGRYTNPAVDSAIERSARTLAAKDRAVLMARATRLAMEDGAIIPLYFERRTWGARAGLTFPGRIDGLTLAAEARGQ